MSNIDTGNLTGTAGTDSITLTGAQLDAILTSSGTINLGSGTGDTINLTSTSTELNTLGATNTSIQGVEAISAATAGAGVTITLSAQTESFSITGSDFADTITGGDAADTIAAGAGNDTINLASGDFDSGESIDGGANSDAIVLASGTTVDFSVGTVTNVEALTSGNGSDTVTLSALQLAGLGTVNLANGTDTLNVVAGGEISQLVLATMSNIDTGNLTGTAGTDSITLTGAQLNAILTGSGTINLGAGTGDTINLTSTSTELNTLGGTNTSIQGVEAISAATAGAGVTIMLSGQTEAFSITGSGFADTITGGEAADTITAGAGNDTINLASGDFDSGESIDGGANSDTIALASGTVVDFSVGTVTSVETLTGSTGNEIVTLSALQLAGLGTVNLANGTDTLNVVANGNISQLALAALSNIDTGNLTGTAGTDFDHPYRRSAQCNPDRLGHHQSRFRHWRHDQSDVDVVRAQHVGRHERIDRRGGGDLRGDGRGRRHDHAVGSDRSLLDHRQRLCRYHHRRPRLPTRSRRATATTRSTWPTATSSRANRSMAAPTATPSSLTMARRWTSALAR